MSRWGEVEAEAPELAARAIEVTDPQVVEARRAGAPPGPMHLFHAGISELVVVSLGVPADHIVIETWHAGRGVSRHRH